MSNPNPNQNKKPEVKKESESGEQKSKADLRRERKAIQEEQRAKKAAATEAKTAQNKQAPQVANATKPAQQASNANKPKPQQVKPEQPSRQTPPPDVASEQAKSNLKPALKQAETSASSTNLASSIVNKSKLFHHFDQYKRDYSVVERFGIDNPRIHPAFIKLGIQYAHDEIIGSNARCLAFLNAFTKFLHDYKAPTTDVTISKDLESKLKPNIK